MEQDIRRRGLWAGDPYLSASEVAAMLSVSRATANRAMQTLAERRMLVRRRNLGTFVGPHFEVKPGSRLRTLCVLMPTPALDRNTIPLESFIYAMRSRLAASNVQIHFLPDGDAQGYVRDLLEASDTAESVAGFVPIGCPREIYRRLADSGIPTVVFGTPYVDQRDIASVDVDNRAAGRLLMEFLTGSGHRRMAVLMAAEGLPGTNCFFDGVSEALTAAELPHKALIVRHVPLEPAAVAAQVHELLTMPERPTALIVRTPQMVRMALMAFERLDVPAADRCEIVYQNHPATEPGELPLTCAQPRISFAEIVGQIGEMLEQLGRGETLEEKRVVIPMELRRKER
jgi:DNA-binding LacI/PurR family transcriptional regulator